MLCRPYFPQKYACFCFTGQINCLDSNFKIMCSDYMAVYISVQCFQPQQKAESFQFSPCTFGDSYKTGLIHMDFSPIFWLSLFQGFLKSPAEFYCPEFLPMISQANRFRLFFQKCSLILCHHGQKFMATLRETKIKL